MTIHLMILNITQYHSKLHTCLYFLKSHLKYRPVLFCSEVFTATKAEENDCSAVVVSGKKKSLGEDKSPIAWSASAHCVQENRKAQANLPTPQQPPPPFPRTTAGFEKSTWFHPKAQKTKTIELSDREWNQLYFWKSWKKEKKKNNELCCYEEFLNRKRTLHTGI